MKLLFITRKYPPRKGGMETVCYALANEFAKTTTFSAIIWKGSQLFLPYFGIKALFQSLYYRATRNISHIHLGDGVLAPIGLLLKWITGAKVSVTVHGLDITYQNLLYRCHPWMIARLDAVICVSRATKAICVQRGIPRDKIAVIPWGVYPEELTCNGSRSDLAKLIGIDLTNRKVLLTVGRLIKRKGVAWFVQNVMPKLNDDYVYLIVGEGIERENIDKAIAESNLNSRVKVLGNVSDDQKKLAYHTADMFIMPNIPIADDMEGFGIVAIEAAATGLPTIASNVDGISDAVIEGETGDLVPHSQSDMMKNAIVSMQLSRNQVKTAAKVFNWDKVVRRYLEVIQ